VPCDELVARVLCFFSFRSFLIFCLYSRRGITIH